MSIGIRHIVLIAGLLIPSVLYGQNNGAVFVDNDFENGSTNTIHVKWFANKVYYQGGFNVYRADAGASNWTLLNSQPLRPAAEVPQNLIQQDSEYRPLLKIVNDTEYDEFQEGLYKVFVALKALHHNEFAELLGVYYVDNTVNSGRSYQYRVAGITNGQEEIIDVSSEIRAERYRPGLPPENIEANRIKGAVTFIWKPDELRYYGVNVYKREYSNEWQKITELPRSVRQYEDQNGNLTYPEFFYIDTEAVDSIPLTYKLTTIDYFGQESSESDEHEFESADFDAPGQPLSLRADIKNMVVKLTWKLPLDPDINTIEIHRSPVNDTTISRINRNDLPANTESYDDKIDQPGGYYYNVAAVDAAGNKSWSGVIFLEIRDVVPPAPPQDIKVSADSGRIDLRWAANKEPDLKGYYVYRSIHNKEHPEPEFIVVNKEVITGTSYTNKLPSNIRNEFLYAVVAVDTSHNRSELSFRVNAQMPDTRPPESPFVKSINVVPDSAIVVEWLDNPDADLKGYDIYRSETGEDGSYEKVNIRTYSATSFQYTDRFVDHGKTYYYYVVSIDEIGNRSLPSNIYSAVYPDTQTNIEDIGKVKISYKKGKKQLTISWSEDNAHIGYVLYRGLSSDNLLPITGLIKTDNYLDKDLEDGKTYWYQLRAYDTKGNIDKSEVLEQKIEVE